MATKLAVGVIFGGRSGEHEVSLVSATSVMSALDKNKYTIMPIGITKEGRWFAGIGVIEALKACKNPPAAQEVSILPIPTRKGLFNLSNGELTPIDVVFPVLHGTFGEDGTIQGLFEMAGIAYVGASVVGSSVGMDKIIQKDVARQAGILVAPSLWFLTNDLKSGLEKIITQIEKNIAYPCFVKPSNSGSSVGIAKAHNRQELEAALQDAARYDRRILVEKSIEKAREIEVSVLGNDNPRVSCPGEVIPSNEFYDYDAKYVDGKSKTIAPADLPDKIVERLKEISMTAFKSLDLCGMARMDFLVKDNDIYFNEANTIPGFTSISMYPKLWEVSGLPYAGLLDELINLAIKRHKEKAGFLTSYKPKEAWYR